MRIGEFACAGGVTVAAVRRYERSGLLPPTARAGGQRRYDTAALFRLRAIAAWERDGFTVDDIAQLLCPAG